MLAAKAGVTLHYEEGGAHVRTERKTGQAPGTSVNAHRVAEKFYQQLPQIPGLWVPRRAQLHPGDVRAISGSASRGLVGF